MREIKFRAWDKLNNQIIIVLWFDDKHVAYKTGLAPRKDCELMQYTGLKDKNEKEIYEGDICANYYGKSFIVKYDYGCFLYDDNEPLAYCPEDCEFTDTQKWCTVIGNIYENSELLKEK